MDKKERQIKIFAAISFIIMIIFNILTYVFPPGGRNIKEIALSYPNLVFPSIYAHYIWILIYLLLGLFALYQLDLFHKNHNQIKKEVMFHTQISFIAFCWLDMMWITAWLYDYMALSSVILIIIVICIRIVSKSLCTQDLSHLGKFLVKPTFSILYGWLTISVMVNFVLLLKSIGWKGFGIPIPLWAAATLIGVAVYAAVRTRMNRDVIYCLTIIWCYIGILIKHVSKAELNSQYPLIICAVAFCLAILAGSAGFLIYTNQSGKIIIKSKKS